MELFYKQCRNNECPIHFSALYARPRLEIWVPDVGPLNFSEHFRFYRRMINYIHLLINHTGMVCGGTELQLNEVKHTIFN